MKGFSNWCEQASQLYTLKALSCPIEGSLELGLLSP